MTDDRYTGQIKKIRAWLNENPEGDLRSLYGEFGGEEMRATLKALEYFEKRKEVTLAAQLYRYNRKHGNEGRETRQTAIFRTMRYKAKADQCLIVSFKYICDTAPAEASYARRYLKFLESLGMIRIRPTKDGDINIAVFPKIFELTATPHFNQRAERRKSQGADI